MTYGRGPQHDNWGSNRHFGHAGGPENASLNMTRQREKTPVLFFRNELRTTLQSLEHGTVDELRRIRESVEEQEPPDSSTG